MDLHALTPAQRRILAVVVLAAVVLVVGLPRALHHSQARTFAPVRPARATPAVVASVIVDVAGAVRRPGLYHLAKDARVADAVAAAGGGTRRADLDAVNLAAPVADGVQVLVPARVPGGVAPAGGGAGGTAGPVDLNSATATELDALPGIGPATAQKIVDFRQAHGAFRSLAELDAIPGIGPGRIAQLKGLVTPG